MPTLHWHNDDEARRAARDVLYRLLEEDPALFYGDSDAQNLRSSRTTTWPAQSWVSRESFQNSARGCSTPSTQPTNLG